MRKIGAVDSSAAPSRKGKREVACPAAKIEDDCVRAIKNRAQSPCSPGAPQAVELAREQMVKQIVARRDLREHLADLARGVSFGLSAFRARAFGRRSCGFSHGNSTPWEASVLQGVARTAEHVGPLPTEYRHTIRPCRCAETGRSEFGHRGPSCPSAWKRLTFSPGLVATSGTVQCAAPA